MFRIELTFDPPLKEFVRRWDKARKAGLKAAGELWIQKFLRRHFTREGASRYGYKPRVAPRHGYSPRRARGGSRNRGGDPRPLVHSGRLVSSVSRSAKVKVYGASARIEMEAPEYIRFRGHRGTGPDMVEELTTVTGDEAEELAEAYAAAIEEELSRVRRRRRIR